MQENYTAIPADPIGAWICSHLDFTMQE